MITNRRYSMILAISLIASIVALPGAVTTVQADPSALVAHDTIRVDSDEDLEDLVSAEGWDGSGTDGDPYIIENLEIDADGAGAAIYLGNTTAHVIVRNCLLYGADWISQPYLMGGGLHLYNVKSATLESNDCHGNADGVFMVYSSDNVITGNDFNDNPNGIYIVSSTSNIIERNFCTESAYNGIHLQTSSDNSIVNNSLSDNVHNGILLDFDSDYNLIYGNMFTGNNGASSIYDDGHIQAYDDGTNYWNTSSYGNYWSDWTSPDKDRDGIVDSSYTIDGGSNKDRFPMAVPLPEVEITSPLDDTTVHAPTVLVTGTATPGYPIKVNSFLVNVEDNGTFAVVIALLEGDNAIKATSMISSLPEASSSVTVTYVNQLQQDVDDLNAQLDDALSQLNETRDDIGGANDDSLPLVLGGVAMIVGLAAITLFLVYARKPRTP
jgi:parallel beta-helix repeat protein